MKMTNIETKTLTTKIKKVEQTKFMSKKGVETIIVLVKTEDGTFSNFMNVWKA